MVSLSVHSFSFMRHNDLFQPPLFASLYDFGFLLYYHSIFTSVLGPSLLSFCYFESTSVPLTVLAFFNLLFFYFFFKKAKSELDAVLTE